MTATRLLTFVSLLVLALAQSTSRILGGENADTTSYPYVTSVRLDNAHICGGTILSAKHVITAAHCVMDKISSRAVDSKRLSLRVGSTNQFAGGKLIGVKHIKIHPDYVALKNDIAILILAESLAFNERVKSIPYLKSISETPAADSELTIAGWGEKADGASPYKLQYTKLTIANEDACKNAYKDKDESVICLNHKTKHGSCRGDAGNGAVQNGVLVAVSNFIVGACGARYPDVYGNVGYFAKWINSVLSEDLQGN